jgi:hypothetical protein
VIVVEVCGICAVTLIFRVYVAVQHNWNYRVIPDRGKYFLLRCSKAGVGF